MRWSEAQLAEHLARRMPAADALPIQRKRRAPASRVPQASETEIHEAVAQHLRLRGRRGVPWWHTPNGEHRDPAIGAKLKRMGTKPGVPDVLLVIEGRLHGLELKRERGSVVSAEQRAMHADLQEAGAVIETARGLDEALEVLEAWGALMPANKGTGP
jgi:hypothetical protein